MFYWIEEKKIFCLNSFTSFTIYLFKKKFLLIIIYRDIIVIMNMFFLTDPLQETNAINREPTIATEMDEISECLNGIIDRIISETPPLVCSLCNKEGHLQNDCNENIMPTLDELSALTDDWCQVLDSVCTYIYREHRHLKRLSFFEILF